VNCEFATLTKGARCIHPGCSVKLPCDFSTAPLVTCKGRAGVMQTVWNYGMAVTQWIAAGRPRRTTEEIQRLAAICRDCEHYVDDARPHCVKCGCTCGEGENPMTNKIAMATEHCPIDKW
jgi:hypothetical protein